MDIYFGGFASEQDLIEEFEIEEEKLADCDILLASYGLLDYEGDAFILFTKDDKLFKVNAGHRSCYGLEDQWEPEETNWEVLKHRHEKGELLRDYAKHSKEAAIRLEQLLKEKKKMSKTVKTDYSTTFLIVLALITVAAAAGYKHGYWRGVKAGFLEGVQLQGVEVDYGNRK